MPILETNIYKIYYTVASITGLKYKITTSNNHVGLPLSSTADIWTLRALGREAIMPKRRQEAFGSLSSKMIPQHKLLIGLNLWLLYQFFSLLIQPLE